MGLVRERTRTAWSQEAARTGARRGAKSLRRAAASVDRLYKLLFIIQYHGFTLLPDVNESAPSCAAVAGPSLR
jgi:hypothetical protein